jgi:hypothetical protein
MRPEAPLCEGKGGDHQVTSFDSPYEAWERPDLMLKTAEQLADELADKVIAQLFAAGRNSRLLSRQRLPPPNHQAMPELDNAGVRKRSSDLLELGTIRAQFGEIVRWPWYIWYRAHSPFDQHGVLVIEKSMVLGGQDFRKTSKNKWADSPGSQWFSPVAREILRGPG